MSGRPFYRSDIAKLLNVTPLTIANREKSGVYPAPVRDQSNGYRKYSLRDAANLMRITYGRIDYPSLVSLLYDKGERDPKVVGRMIDNVIREISEGR